METIGDKHIDDNQILFSIEEGSFNVKIGKNLDFKEVYTVLLSALMYLEAGNTAHPTKELH